ALAQASETARANSWTPASGNSASAARERTNSRASARADGCARKERVTPELSGERAVARHGVVGGSPRESAVVVLRGKGSRVQGTCARRTDGPNGGETLGFPRVPMGPGSRGSTGRGNAMGEQAHPW